MNYYPSEEVLTTIQAWPMDTAHDLPAFLAQAWNSDYGRVEETSPGFWVFATGGWSGNEDLIQAAKESPAWFLVRLDMLSLGGGIYIFAVTPAADQRLEKIQKTIMALAWSADAAHDS